MSTSDSEVVVDHVSDLSSAKEPILFLSCLFVETDLVLEVGVLDDHDERRATPAHTPRVSSFRGVMEG